MTELSNTSPLLMELAEKIKAANEAVLVASRTTAEKAIEAGWLLCKAKAICAHGDWLPFLSQAGVHKRQAQRLMQIAASGLEMRHVSLLGGIKATCEFLSSWRMPTFDEAMFITREFTDTPPDPQSIEAAYIWESREHPGHYDIRAISEDTYTTLKGPMKPTVQCGDDRPVNTVVYWLTQNLSVPIDEWRVEFLPIKIAKILFADLDFELTEAA
jgi:hypothetical protein